MASVPAFLTGGPSPRARLDAIARDALSGLTPVVVVNRRADVALDQVDGASDEPFPTIHTDGRTDLETTMRRAYRSVNEQVRDTHGHGDDAGHTVYGSVRFVAAEDAAAGAERVIDALMSQGDVGVRAYGPVSFVLAPDAMRERATFAADDTGVTMARVHAPEDIATVVADRLERGTPTAPSVERLLQMPSRAAQDAVRGWLLTDDVGGSTGYMEAQVRRFTPGDVFAAVVDARDAASVVRRDQVDPGTTPTGAQIEALSAHLARHEVPVRVLADPPSDA